MNPQMQRAVGQFASAFNDTLRATAGSAGVGDDYAQAMQLYARSKAWQKFGAGAWDVAKKALPTAIGIGAGGRLALSHLLDYAP
jgi:hypothetical protein